MVMFCIDFVESVYDATLNTVKQTFPQYVRELEGVADGAQVDFHKVSLTRQTSISMTDHFFTSKQRFYLLLLLFLQLFLLHMDDITPSATNQQNGVHPPIGCSTICVNNKDFVSHIQQSFPDFFVICWASGVISMCDMGIFQEILGHTEDALVEALNHFYIVSAHITEPTQHGKNTVSEIK